MYQNVNFQEKRDREVRKALEREELSSEEIKELRSTIAPVEAKEVVVYDSGDEDARSDLLLKCKISLERGRKTARENQRRGSPLLALLSGKYKAPSQQVSVKDLMERTKAARMFHCQQLRLHQLVWPLWGAVQHLLLMQPYVHNKRGAG